MAVMGRPIKYSPVFIKKVDEYLATCVDKECEFHKTRGFRSDSFERVLKVNLPKIEGFSEYVGVPLSTIYDWEKTRDDFSEALNKIRKAQHNRLVDESLSGNYNPVIAKLMLSSNHGYKEKSDITSDNKELQPVLVRFINESIPQEETKDD